MASKMNLAKFATTDDVIDFMVERADLFGVKLTRRAAKTMYEALVQFMLTQTVEKGWFRLPQGWGSLNLHFQKGERAPKRLPNGTVIQPKNRPFIRYREGAAIKEMLGASVDYDRERPRPRHVPFDEEGETTT
jgi:hypothetical protein